MSRRQASLPLTAFVLHRYDWSESSLIVELFTRERGRVVVAAKGAKRPYSQLRPVLLPFQRIGVQLGRTPADAAAEIHTLRSAEWGGGTTMARGAALFRGFYVNELLLKLLARQDPHERLFDAYEMTLAALAGAAAPAAAAALRAFELTLLRETGVLPQLDRDTLAQQPLRADADYVLRPESGLGSASGEPPFSASVPAGVWTALEAALAQGRLEAVQAACLRSPTPLRLQLRALLHYHLGTPLRTRAVMLDVQRLIEANAAA